ncbi:MAG: glycosyltransferase family 2 protein [Succinivibrio sp.]
MNRYLIIIPCYRHAQTLDAVLSKLEHFKIDAVVIDDGNCDEQSELIRSTLNKYPFATLLKNEVNMGKGASVSRGLRYADEHGYTHALQVDSDGQHNLDDLEKLINLSNSAPECVISGKPLYDEDAPRSRVIGRKITNFFVHVETLSCVIEDAMIGFRSYPVSKTIDVINRCSIGSRMNFDIEILVRLVWNGVPCRFFATQVIYPKSGISNFRAKDNLMISLMHTKLCILSFLTLPVRLFKNAR